MLLHLPDEVLSMVIAYAVEADQRRAVKFSVNFTSLPVRATASLRLTNQRLHRLATPVHFEELDFGRLSAFTVPTSCQASRCGSFFRTFRSDSDIMQRSYCGNLRALSMQMYDSYAIDVFDILTAFCGSHLVELRVAGASDSLSSVMAKLGRLPNLTVLHLSGVVSNPKCSSSALTSCTTCSWMLRLEHFTITSTICRQNYANSS